VIAVHRGAKTRANLQYLGRTVGYVNFGTRMSLVLDRLRDDHPALERQIRYA
jgi:hypothetical protein